MNKDEYFSRARAFGVDDQILSAIEPMMGRGPWYFPLISSQEPVTLGCTKFGGLPDVDPAW